MRPWLRRSADLTAALHAFERWLLPASCLLCGEPVAMPESAARDEPLICDLCRLRWRPIPPPVCLRCGQPRFGDAECLLCREWPAGLTRVRSAVWLEGRAREAAHRLKYDGWWRAADVMAEAMRSLEPLTGQISLVPIPLGGRRRRGRGYNQSECIAGALGAKLGLRVCPDMLMRIRETGTQTALTPEQRHANVHGAFGPGTGAAGAAGARLVLVDDVFTTGATLVAAASVLTSLGAARVDAVTFARAATFEMRLMA